MTTAIKIGLVSIPIMFVNYSNSRYSSEGLHQFSACCGSPVGNKRYCKGCGKDLLNSEIKKGLDKDTILSDTQSEKLKELLEGGLMEVIAVRESFEIDKIVPYIQKTQMILPSLSKGYRKTDIKVFISFKEALKELNKVCIVKLTQRNLEHLGLLMNLGEDLAFIELPFKHYNNLDEVKRMREAVDNVLVLDKIENPTEFKSQAKDFISSFGNKVNELDEAVEEKKVLLKQFIKQIREKGESEFLEENEMSAVQTEVNPFAIRR